MKLSARVPTAVGQPGLKNNRKKQIRAIAAARLTHCGINSVLLCTDFAGLISLVFSSDISFQQMLV